jgi:hypothetical protein
LANFNILEDKWESFSDVGACNWSSELALASGGGVEIATSHDLFANIIMINLLLLLLMVVKEKLLDMYKF